MVLSRYASFYQKMAYSPSWEVAMMAELIGKDARTTTSANLKFVSSLTSLNCAEEDWRTVKAALPVSEVPEKERWRLGLLDALLVERAVLEKEGKDAKRIVAMISSLCST